MTTARDDILSRIRLALRDVTEEDPALDVPVAWQYGRPTDVAHVLDLFVERVEDYRAVVERVTPEELPGAIARHLADAGAHSVVLPSGIDAAWRAAVEGSFEVLSDDPPLTNDQLNRADAVLTAAAVGIAMPGVRDPDSGRLLSANVPALTGQRVQEDLQHRLQRPLQFGNDMQCFALSEANGGAADGQPSMLGAILGTGAGGGYCVHGRLVSGYNGIAGEWGHWSVPAHLLERHGLPLLDCGCGLRGCVERYIAGGGVAMLHRHLGGDPADASIVIERAHQGDALAMRALQIHLDLLGHTLAAVVLALDPHVIVLGGGLSKDARLYRELPAAVATHLFGGVRVPPILPPAFGDAGDACRGQHQTIAERDGHRPRHGESPRRQRHETG